MSIIRQIFTYLTHLLLLQYKLESFTTDCEPGVTTYKLPEHIYKIKKVYLLAKKIKFNVNNDILTIFEVPTVHAIDGIKIQCYTINL